VITETRLGNKRVTKEEARTSEVYCTEVGGIYIYVTEGEGIGMCLGM